ncbi:MAG: hypothetical protein ACFFC7_33350 [Candidatus Hermodarchaeota archaeon]
MSFLKRFTRVLKQLQGQSIELEKIICDFQRKLKRSMHRLELEAVSASVADEEALSFIVVELATSRQLSKLIKYVLEDIKTIRTWTDIPKEGEFEEITSRLAQLNFYLKNNVFNKFLEELRDLRNLDSREIPSVTALEPNNHHIKQILEEIRQKVPKEQSSQYETKIARLMRDKKFAKKLKDAYDKKWVVEFK